MEEENKIEEPVIEENVVPTEEPITETPVVEQGEVPVEPVQSLKKSKKGIIIVAIVVLIAVAVAVFLLLSNKDEDKKEDTKKDTPTEEKEDKDDTDIPDDTETPIVDGPEYYNETIEEKTDYIAVYEEDGELTLYGCFDDNCKKAFEKKSNKKDLILDSFDGNIVLYRKGMDVYAYYIDTKKEEKLDVKGYYYDYGLVYDNINKEISGVTYYKNYRIGNYEEGESEEPVLTDLTFYNYKTKKEQFVGKYDYMGSANYGYVVALKEDSKDSTIQTAYLIEISTEKVLKTTKGECTWIRFIGNKNNRLIEETYDACYDNGSARITTFDNKEIFEGEDYQYVLKDDYMLLLQGKKLVKMDYSGKELKSSNSYDKTVAIVGDYFIAVRSNKIYIATLDGYEKELGDWNKNYSYNQYLSGYYDEDELGENEKTGSGIYVIFDKSSDYFDEYYYNIKTKEVTVSKDVKNEGGYAKPVLYLYPTKKTNVTVTFANPKALTTTYPKYINNWNVTAYPNGDLYDKDGNYYYALYWEEKENHSIDFSEGFYVTKDNAIEFLEEKLTTIGFNAKERNEFIMYWLPILEKNEKNLVYFELTEERNKYNKLNINPNPDSMLRVAIHIKKVDKYTKIKEQKLTTFKRTGFTAVEWGGTIHK